MQSAMREQIKVVCGNVSNHARTLASNAENGRPIDELKKLADAIQDYLNAIFHLLNELLKEEKKK